MCEDEWENYESSSSFEDESVDLEMSYSSSEFGECDSIRVNCVKPFMYEPEATDDSCSDQDSDSMQSSSVEDHARIGHTDW